MRCTDTHRSRQSLTDLRTIHTTTPGRRSRVDSSCMYQECLLYLLLYLWHVFVVCVTVCITCVCCMCYCIYDMYLLYVLLYISHVFVVCVTVCITCVCCMSYCMYQRCLLYLLLYLSRVFFAFSIQDVVSKFKISSLPTFLVYYNYHLVSKHENI